jgi:hypothetical protein
MLPYTGTPTVCLLRDQWVGWLVGSDPYFGDGVDPIIVSLHLWIWKRSDVWLKKLWIWVGWQDNNITLWYVCIRTPKILEISLVYIIKPLSRVFFASGPWKELLINFAPSSTSRRRGHVPRALARASRRGRAQPRALDHGRAPPPPSSTPSDLLGPRWTYLVRSHPRRRTCSVPSPALGLCSASRLAPLMVWLNKGVGNVGSSVEFWGIGWTRILEEYSRDGSTQPALNSIQTAIETGSTQLNSLQPPTKHTAIHCRCACDVTWCVALCVL